ncbi:MAG TPA: cytidylate kinase family protein, partial [Bacteroidales bacterium]|nr:cytidylate kinase family protein [Bacteroidales bacterium]
MDNLLVRYFNAKLEVEQQKQAARRKGPVITISRMAGCPAGLVAEALVKRLRNDNVGPDPRLWRIVSKEVLSEAARALGLEERKINYVFESGARTTMDEVIEALSSRYYKSDARIRKTISEVIRTIAASGSVILIGRGGVALTQDIPGSLHIRLQAPEEWRVQK